VRSNGATPEAFRRYGKMMSKDRNHVTESMGRSPENGRILAATVEYQGVRNALRNAFPAPPAPADFEALLNRLR